MEIVLIVLYFAAIGFVIWFAVTFITKFFRLTKDVSEIEYNLRVLIDKLDAQSNSINS